jgi:plastocyanin
MNSKLLIGLVAVVIIIVVALVALGGSKNESQPSETSSTVPTQAQSQQQQQVTTVTITADSSGFSPAQLTVKTGTRVIWTNKSGSDISVNSAEHPTHRLFRELNLGHVPNDSNASVVFDKPGTYKYHNHYSPSQTGTVVVE